MVCPCVVLKAIHKQCSVSQVFHKWLKKGNKSASQRSGDAYCRENYQGSNINMGFKKSLRIYTIYQKSQL